MLENIVRQPAALPRRVVRVLNRQRRRGYAVIVRAQLASQNPIRPAVERDVVRGDQQDMIVRGKLQEAAAQRRISRQIERTNGLLAREASSFRNGFVCGKI